MGRRLDARAGGRAAASATGLAGLSDAQLVGQHMIYSYDGSAPTADLLRRVRRGEVAGVLIRTVNDRAPARLRAVTRTLQRTPRPAAVNAPLMILIDQEGGLVKRLGGAPSLSAEQMGQTHDLGLIERQGLATGRNLRSLGINVNLAPVVDVGRPGSFVVQTHRSFSSSAAEVAQMAEAFIKGSDRTGVLSVIKHWAGLGTAPNDQDHVANRIPLSLGTLRNVDELPFQRLAGRPRLMVMADSAVYPPFGSLPTELNRRLITDELRGRLRFQGLVMTDDVGVQALDRFGSYSQRLVEAVRAGNDLLMFARSYAAAPHGAAILERALRDHAISRDQLGATLPHILSIRRGLPGAH